MKKTLIQRAFKITIIFMIAFFILNYLTMKHALVMSVIGRTLLATVVFFIIYIIVFTILSSPKRKIIYGTTIPIALVVCLVLGTIFFTTQIGIICGFILGISVGIVWELIYRNNGGKTS
ncbi:hypothetical protein [Staphylococcus saccharolyticus]|uniref:hypothetical protein n=1 Tax=Staphylococcus saccharolyticus TaxID=33028 RepID=UPI00102DB52E|nr:hypothetical protein [Staphylococcus saccharolyticus]MBL7573613.1 hypothetical protein [Staphylococcus saccharolyticus]MBL7584597.1 hypothetical protein [Staphylococcus saccharolyticus]MBL7639458.1 hypothetical protein [Staphylococcus saccharolyticus]QRJ68773.1 hypothetical protein DMB75_002760 [Staphylococcus saccharolyticus]TAA92094.1 hypothetical protein DMB74_08605 [Staphylococcus saccharolyticus]